MDEQKFNLKNLQEIIKQITQKMAQVQASIVKIKEQVTPVIKQYQQNISSAVKSFELNNQAKQAKLLAYSRAFATGGLLSGYGGGDNVPEMLEPGEWIIKKEAVKKFGADQVQKIRRGYNECPPEGESLANVVERVAPYWEEKIIPAVLQGKKVLIVAHGNLHLL